MILAGGQGTRLRGIFGQTPKHLVPVNERPFADYQVARLVSRGFDRLTYAIGFGASQIRQYFDERAPLSFRVEFVEDGPSPLGTGGALRQLHDMGLLEDTFAVTYGDTLLEMNPQQLFANLTANDTADGVMTVWKNRNFLVDSNASFDGQWVTKYDKTRTADLHFDYIDYGMIALRRKAIEDWVPASQFVDLADMMTRLASDRRLLGLEVFERFYEVGTLDAIRETEIYLATRTTN